MDLPSCQKEDQIKYNEEYYRKQHYKERNNKVPYIDATPAALNGEWKAVNDPLFQVLVKYIREADLNEHEQNLHIENLEAIPTKATLIEYVDAFNATSRKDLNTAFRNMVNEWTGKERVEMLEDFPSGSDDDEEDNVNTSINSSFNEPTPGFEATYVKKEENSSSAQNSLPLGSREKSLNNITNNSYNPYDDDFYIIDFIRLARPYTAIVFESLRHLLDFLSATLGKVLRIVLSGQTKFFWKVNKEDPFSLGVFTHNPLPLNLIFTYKTGGKTKEGKEATKTYPCHRALSDKLDSLSSNHVISVPYHKDQPFIQGDVFNIFPGYKAELIPDFENADYSEIYPLLNHIYTILANSNPELYWWIISWFAHPIRTGTRTDKILVLIGDPGCGKSIIFEFFAEYIYGIKSSYISAGTDAILDKFNDDSANKMFVYIDDAKSADGVGGRVSAFDKLKSITTSPYVKLESKGVKRLLVQNNCNYCFTSNHLDPVRLDNGDRRYCIAKCNNSKAPVTPENIQYFKNISQLIGTKQVDKTIPQRIANKTYSYLRTKGIAANLVDLNNIPMTEIKEDIIEMSLPIVEKFTRAISNKEETIPGKILYIRSKELLPFVSTKALHEEHVIAMKIHNPKYSMGIGKFSAYIKHLWGDKIKAGKATIDGVEIRGYYFLESSLDTILVSMDPTISYNGVTTREKPMTLRLWMTLPESKSR